MLFFSNSPPASIVGHKSRVVYEAKCNPLTEEMVFGEDLLGGALTFGAEPELGTLGLLVLRAEDGGVSKP